MRDYQFEAVRSSKEEDQVPGMKCGLAKVAGTFQANSAREVWKKVESALIVAGVWDCTLRVGNRQLKPRRYYQVIEANGARLAPASFQG